MLRGSDRDRLIALSLLQRRHAAKVLAHAMRSWKKTKLEKLKQGELKFQTFLSAVAIQRAWKRYQKLKWLQRRYQAAQRVQARVRGALTRCLWANDPGISSVVFWVNPRSGFACVRHTLNPAWSPSYSVTFETKVNMHFRGFVGRVAANTAWANMEKRWQWIDPTQGMLAQFEFVDDNENCPVDRQALRNTLLPRSFYHEDKKHHMRSIYNLAVPFRAFAYEFQGVVDLLDDKQGLRCENLPPRPTASTPLTVECPMSALSSDSLRLPATPSVVESIALEAVGITSTMAIFPLGAMVYVRVRNKKLHPATIIRGLVSIRGVAITEAKHVHASRLQYDPPESPPESLTSRIHHELRRVAAVTTKLYTAADETPAVSNQVEHPVRFKRASFARRERQVQSDPPL
ncbi:hypothetical protein B5M09_001064 [Aphanomyces astaci]|uniref:Uncharacterized protein n=1 Tax=Aphanomyces astaci TaxID=112090 RepID=A0A425CZ09_APHAT|nr:hypothetical protein B5M09_001064 [Aphanomyces astaci]